jgi:hypothetical protein
VAGLQYVFAHVLLIKKIHLLVPTGKEKQLPKPQRRGAIIILGMLAVARRSVVTDKVEVMLKIGLGAVGRVSPPRNLLFFY